MLTKISERSGFSRCEEAEQERKLLALADVVEEVLDVLGRDLLGRDRDLDGIVHVLVGELHDLPAQRRREEHRLALVVGRQAAQEEAQVGDEPHVEHAVGLVDHQHLGVLQRVDVLLEVVDQAAGRADQNVAAAAQDLALLGVVDAAVDGLQREPGEMAEAFRVVQDLHDQLARRRDDQGARPLALRLATQQAGEHRDEERRGLAGSGLCLPGNVLAGQRQRQGLFLNRGASGAGEVPLAWAYNFRIERMKREGAPVEWIETFDPIVVTISGIALSSKATHPNTAKLLINFATSRKGQEMVREMRRIPARTDVKPAAAKMDQSKLKLKAVPKEVYSGLDDHAREFRKIFGL